MHQYGARRPETNFECGAFNRSATSPAGRGARGYLALGFGRNKPRIRPRHSRRERKLGRNDEAILNTTSIHDERRRAGRANHAMRRAGTVGSVPAHADGKLAAAAV